MSMLSKLTSGDPHQIWSASCEIAECTDIEVLKAVSNHLDLIKKATKSMQLKGGLCPNTYHVEFALSKLEHVRSNARCLCVMFPSNVSYSRLTEQDSGRVTIAVTADVEDKWV